jgi:hypothetical protein
LTGTEGYEHWIEAISSRTADSLGLAFNADFYARARRLAVEFLIEARQRTGNAFPRLFAEAIEAYETVSASMDRLAALFPLPGNDEWIANDQLREDAVRSLRAAMMAEERGRIAIVRLLKEIDRIW